MAIKASGTRVALDLAAAMANAEDAETTAPTDMSGNQGVDDGRIEQGNA
jgi:hypothetical protein